MKRTLKQVEKEIEETQVAFDIKWHEDNTDRPWNEFLEYARSEIKKLDELSREKRMMMPYKMEEIPDYGDVMSLKDFVECIKDGGFTDDDGYGNYAKDEMMTNINVYPSDVKHNAIRKDFDAVVWFNK